ncbi:dihydropteroate synthase [Acetobacter senegalensis]|uniref:dihydropteroate synthase n=1 Tax=Acetobacter senegalensis TaxID=446692 RepID=UPI00264F9DBE|nr:dihydropteroate synthase [Acetobacter senegalensis]MDN7356244.1 dihydropteroate synthase [Acetobacter senegalensis]
MSASGSDRVQVMGIVNATPDSFSDGGDHYRVEDAISHGVMLAEQGADILDVGGESTRPGGFPVSVDGELRRVIPVIKGLKARTSLPISIDTFKPEVMSKAVKAGASLINDIRALREPGALEIAAQLDVPVILMHMIGAAFPMQTPPEYDDVVGNVRSFLEERIASASAAGIRKENIIIDPGFGFSKTTDDDMTLLSRLQELTALNIPILAGLSRKRSIGAVIRQPVARERVYGSVAAHLLAAQAGARIVRVHDVAPTVDALRVLDAIRSRAARD